MVFQTEFFQLPAPLFEVTGQSTRAVLFGHRVLSKMDKVDRVRVRRKIRKDAGHQDSAAISPRISGPGSFAGR